MTTDPRRREPGPDHPIRIEFPKSVTVEVRLGDALVVRTDDVAMLHEAKYPPVPYVPLSAVDPDLLTGTDHSTFCPFKGDAAYYTVTAGGETAENGVWTYPSPFPAVKEIEGRVAFYPNRFTVAVG